MLHKVHDHRAWFAPKRYGYGAGLPVTWQGWALLASYCGLLGGIRLLDHAGTEGARAAAAVLFVLVTGVFLLIVARHTRGGWKWRWGDRD